jgi:hypothetical protein
MQSTSWDRGGYSFAQICCRNEVHRPDLGRSTRGGTMARLNGPVRAATRIDWAGIDKRGELRRSLGLG